MIKAKNLHLAEVIFNPYLRRLMRKSFSHFHIYGHTEQDTSLTQKGVILVINHFSWWDGFFAYLYCKFVFPARKIRMMMLENQLRRFWFFRYLGCFSINRTNAKSVLESLTYAANEVTSQNILVIYPQGKIEPFDVERIQVESGIRKITEMVKSDFIVRPLVCAIKYGEEKLPSVEIMPGNDKKPTNSKEVTQVLQSELMLTRKSLQQANAAQATKTLW